MKGFLILIASIILPLSACPYDSLLVSGQINCNTPKWMIDSKICASECPSRFTPETIICSPSYNCCSKPSGNDAILFTLNFFSVQILEDDRIQDSDTGIEFLNTFGAFKDPSKNSPLPTLDRGFYFTTTSGALSNDLLIPGLYFILNLWIKPLADGEILDVQIGTDTYISIAADSGVFKLSAAINDSSGFQIPVYGASTISYSSSWQYVSIYLNQATCDTGLIGFKINGNSAGSTPLANSEISFPSGTYTWTLGKVIGATSFRGFIYWLQVRADNDASYPTVTPTINCVNNQYWDGASCQDCDSNCQTWPWCIRGSDCSICYSEDCFYCLGYASDMCNFCDAGIDPNCCDHLGTVCTQVWSNTECSTGFPNDGVCLYGFPYGWYNCGGSSCYAVLTVDFNDPFSGIYSSAFITGDDSSSYNFWNSPETSDPFPAKNRGLYFNSNQYLSASINLSNTWTMGMWVYPISGTIIGHSTNQLAIDTTGYLYLDLETWDGTTVSLTVSNSGLSVVQWTYIFFSIGFSNKCTTIYSYANDVFQDQLGYCNYVFRLVDNEKLYIGKGSTMFKGFISYFQLWGTHITDFTVPYNHYGFTNGVVNTLWPCQYAFYYDGSQCKACLGGAPNGCVRDRAYAVCDDLLCAKCSSFLPNSCIICADHASGSPCKCNDGYWQYQDTCNPCNAKCLTCASYLDSSCMSCHPGDFSYGGNLCLISCPTGFIEDSVTGACTFSSYVGLSLALYDEIKLDSVSGVQVGPSNNIYPNYETGDTYPQYLQGYYFKTDSYMSTNAVIGPDFTISIWIYPTASGTIVTKKVSGTKILCLELIGGSPKLSVTLSDNSAYSITSSSNALTSSWSFISFTGYMDFRHTITISSYFNSIATESGYSPTQAYLQDQSSGTLYIGHHTSGTNSFEGFLYNVKIFNSQYYQISDYSTSSCISPCTQCPSDHICPKTCSFLSFFNGLSCESCDASCNKGCRYSSSIGTCVLCKTPQCYQCDTFSGACSSCITNAESDGSGGCKCKAGYYWKLGSCILCDGLCSVCKETSSFYCSTCVSGMQIVDDLCIYGCPYGYGASCAVVSNAVIDEYFDTDFQGSYGIFTTGAQSSKYQHFKNPESIDPIPAYKRGLYFDGTMYLQSSSAFFLSHSFSIGVWVWDLADRPLILKNQLEISTDGSIKAGCMEDNIPSATPYVNSLTQGSSLTAWNYVSVVVYYTQGHSVFEIYVNGIRVKLATIVDRIFRERSSSKLRIGRNNTTGLYGFVYNFQLWNVRITDFLTILNGFTFCGSGMKASCLSTCYISQFQNGGSCSDCSSCSKGCVRNNSCNICYDLLCLVCTGFSIGKCTQCEVNADLISGSCFCKPSFAISSDGLSCIACPSECYLCIDAVYNKCTACNTNFYLFASTGQCLSECPTGYIINSTTGKCDYLSNLGIKLDLIDQIRLGTVSGFNVGNDNANSYPNWSDANDPIPAYKRGYYFKKNNYLASTVMIAPIFTISIWTKPLSSGILVILVTKYTSSDIMKIAIDPSGYPILSIIFSDSTSLSLTTSTSILNTWHFLSFSGQIQSNGKTILTLYINTISTNSITTASLTYFKDTNSGTLYVGNDETLGNSGLFGYLAQLIIYNSYNYQSNDYTTSSCISGCSACPTNQQCLSECDFDKYPDACTTCPNCSQGCVSSFTCGLCRDKECYSCTSFSGECIDCITNAENSDGHCKCLSNAIWISSSRSCEFCDPICESCSTINFNGCLKCISGFYLVQSLCVPFCPTGYILKNNNCLTDPTYSNFLVFNLMPHQIKDIVLDLASNIPVITGKNHKFYPTYDITDPLATIYRGYYFSGSSYMQLPPYEGSTSPSFTFSPKFVISTWIKPISETGTILSKQINSGEFTKYISLKLINNAPSLTLTLKDATTIIYTSNNPLLKITLSQWNFVSGASDLSASQIIRLTTNSNNDISSNMHASWLIDSKNSFLFTIGACYYNSMALKSFFNGFLWDLKIYNSWIAVSSLTLNTCNGCSLCPIDNDNNCLDDCLLDSYWNGNSCGACSSRCLNKGCVRNDKSCNLCQDIICEICDDYISTCITCKTNASLIDTNCQCNSGYFWNSTSESCDLCSDLDCSVCNIEYYSAESCKTSTFSANLTVFSDNSFILVFNESLAKNFTINDFTVVIENQGQISCQVEQVNSISYHIFLTIKNTISKGTLAEFKFLNPSEIRSISNSTLNSSNFTVSLNYYDSDQFSSMIETSALQGAALAQTTVASALALSFVSSNPSSLWSIMNTLEILSYLTLSGIPFSTKLRIFLNYLNSFNLFPNIFSYFIDQSEGNTAYSEAVSFGYETDLILINEGSDFSLILASIAVLPLVFYFSRCSNRWIGKKLTKTIKSYHFAFYLRFWIQCYLGLGAATSIGIIDINFKNATQITNFIICIAISALIITTPWIFFWFSYKNKIRILSRDKKILSEYNPFFFEFRANQPFLATQYYFVFFLRRLIYIINLVYLRNYPGTEVTVNIVLSLMTIMHLLFYWPFKEQILQYCNLVTEILISWIMGLTVIYLFEIESDTLSKIEDFIILIVVVIVGVQLLSSIILFARALYKFVSDKFRKTID